MAHRRQRAPACRLLALGLATLACDAGTDHDATPCLAQLALVAPAEDGALAELTDGDALEVIEGFQGFRFVRLGFRLGPAPEGGAAPELATVDVRASAATPSPHRTRRHDVAVSDRGDGLVAYPVEIYFNDTALADLVGKTCQLDAQVTWLCSRDLSRSLRLVHRPGCIEAPSGEIVCDPP